MHLCTTLTDPTAMTELARTNAVPMIVHHILLMLTDSYYTLIKFEVGH